MRVIGGLFIALLIVFLFLINSNENKEFDTATWIWDTELIMNDANEIIEFIEFNKINTVYLQFNPNVEEKYYQEFIALLSEKNTTVYALDGSPTWAENSQEEEAFLSWFTSYQSSAFTEQQFKGIHLDVEPYLQDKWETDGAEVVREYQEMIKRVSQASKNLGVEFGVDIPFWFDEIEFTNQFGSGYLAHWIIRNVDEITIMAYRNHSEGEGGIIDISKNEVAWANDENKKVIVAVETVLLPEEYTTFYGENREKLNEELQKVQRYFKKDRSFGGVAIHHLVSWKDLEKNP